MNGRHSRTRRANAHHVEPCYLRIDAPRLESNPNGKNLKLRLSKFERCLVASPGSKTAVFFAKKMDE